MESWCEFAGAEPFDYDSPLEGRKPRNAEWTQGLSWGL